MLFNYLKVTFRNLLRQKFYSFINIFGLTVGIAATMLIVLYVSDELSYDKFHVNADRIYRVGIRGVLSGSGFAGSTSCSPMASTIVDQFPEVESAVRISQFDNILVRVGDKALTEPKMLLADSNFFEFFSFELLEGDQTTALKDPNQLVLSESAAKKYFGYPGPGVESPIGQSMSIYTSNRECTVTGIAKDPPMNSHFTFDLILSISSWEFSRNTQWTSNSLYTYFTVREGSNIEETKLKFMDLVETYVGPEIEEYLGMTMDEFRENGGEYGYVVEPLTDIHLKSTLEYPLEPGGNIQYLYIFSAIAIFLIFIACINFMNLSTAKSAMRAKEVGVRKTIGARRERLISQFLVESVMLSMISMVLAWVLIYLLIDPFNQLAGKSLAFNPLDNFWLSGGIFLVSLFTGILAGIYPAFYLTSFKPVEVLKGKLTTRRQSNFIRSSLVIFQFTISITLIICTTIVYRQLIHMQNKNLGLNKENVLIIDNGRSLGSNFDGFIENLKSYPDIVSVSSSNMLPPRIMNNSVFRPAGAEEDHLIYFYTADYEHLEVMGMEMREGRYYSKDFPSDSGAVVLNEAAMKQIGWDNYEGKEVYTFFNSDDDPPLKVIGVVKDFNFESLRNEIKPLAIILGSNNNFISVKLSGGDLQKKIKFVENKWKEYSSNAPFEFTFLDQDFAALFRTEQQMGKIFLVFTILAIFIASLGLYGLSTFTASQRAKEISIRKVMGATLNSIITLLSIEFARLILIAFIISIPLAYWSMSRWLEGFAYKIEIGILTFFAAGMVALLITMITISYQSLKAGIENPVKALRNE